MSLHILERKCLEFLAKKHKASLEEVASNTNMNPDQVRRTLEWLKSKKLVIVKPSSVIKLSLGPAGKISLKLGLPETRLVKILLGQNKKGEMSKLSQNFKGNKQEFSVAIGQARGKKWVYTEKNNVTFINIPDSIPEEVLLERISKEEVYMEKLSPNERNIVNELMHRQGYLFTKEIRNILVSSTEAGIKAVKDEKFEKRIEAITPDLLASGQWKKHTLRSLNVEAPSAVASAGKKHPVQRFIDEVREIFVSLGFEEIDGPIIQPSFWNFDALFTPQDHPAREIQDTFYISNLQTKNLSKDKIVNKISEVHENGGSTGSTGWGYKWKLDEARRIVLRTHTTAVTIKYLADHKVSEASVFSIGRVFRNEKVTFKNLIEFHQIEGINIGNKVNLRNMMGLLSAFYRKLGLKKIKFWPSYFPYTEPSIQSMVYHEQLGKWVELCGMGIFRPEVTLPLGVKNPVLAWGGGLERLVMLRYGISDVRQLYENNLGWLRRTPSCL